MSHRGEALRLAIYLDTAGLVPNCRECRTWDDAVAALSVQFFSLPPAKKPLGTRAKPHLRFAAPRTWSPIGVRSQKASGILLTSKMPGISRTGERKYRTPCARAAEVLTARSGLLRLVLMPVAPPWLPSGILGEASGNVNIAVALQ